MYRKIREFWERQGYTITETNLSGIRMAWKYTPSDILTMMSGQYMGAKQSIVARKVPDCPWQYSINGAWLSKEEALRAIKLSAFW